MQLSNIHCNTFSHTRRPIILYSDCRRHSCQLSFLNENVFSILINLNIKNTINFTKQLHQINCNDCRSYWLRKNSHTLKELMV